MSSQETPAELPFETTRVVRDARGEVPSRAYAAPARVSFWLPIVSLWWREIVRFYRQRSRWVGVVLSPVIFWLIVGSGLGSSFRAEGSGGGYLEYFFPGTLVLTLLFTSIFCMMSVIEDRREGFLLSVLVSPAPRASIVLGKILGGTTLAVLQGVLLLLLAPLAGVGLDPSRALAVLGVMFLISFGLTALGFCIAWKLDSTHGFHALVNLFMVPMWLLSGALFPISGASTWVGWMMRLNPLTYGVVLLRRAFYAQESDAAGPSALSLALAVSVVSCVVVFLFALKVASSRARGAKA